MLPASCQRFQKRGSGHGCRRLKAEWGGVRRVGFLLPVVPQGWVEIRMYLLVSHTRPLMELAETAFVRVGKQAPTLGTDREGIIEHFGL